jgi:molybdate transport system substrate-binding protein
VKAGFEQEHPGTLLQLHLAAASTLRSELRRGMTADVLIAADMATIDSARADGTLNGAATVFAHHRLAMVVPSDNPSVAVLQDLGRPGLRLVAELDSVAAGAAARQSLTDLSANPSFGAEFGDSVLGNVVVQEKDVKAVLARLQSGDADAAIMYVADTSTSTPGALKVVGMPGADPPISSFQWHSNELGTIISDAFTVVDDCPAAMVNGAPNADGAAAFIAYLESSAGQERLSGAGLVQLVS